MLARFDRTLTCFFGFLFFVGACLISISIVVRETGGGHSWIDPVVRYTVIWCALLGLWASGGRKEDPHISAELLVSYSGPGMRRVLNMVRYLVAIFFIGTLGYLGWVQVASELKSGIREQSILGMHYAYLHMVIPIAAALYVLVTLGRLRNIWLGREG